MKRLLIAAIVASAMLIPVSVQAKDVTLPPLNDAQQSALIQLLDIAVKSGGLAISQNANFFYAMIVAAQNAPAATTPAPDAAKPGNASPDAKP